MAKKHVPLQVKKPPKVEDAEAFVAGEGSKGKSKPSQAEEETVRLTVYVPADLVREVKVAAIDRRTTASALVRDALQSHLDTLASK